MPDWSLIEGQEATAVGLNTATSSGTTVTPGTNTKGSWAQLVASTAHATHMLTIMFAGGGTTLDYLVDIGIGAASSEVVIVPDLIVHGGTGGIVYPGVYMFPIEIPAGTRIAARATVHTGTTAIHVSAVLHGQGFNPSSPLSLVRAFGATLADSGGISIDSGGTTANTKGAYSELVASTTYPIKMLALGIGNQANGTRTNASYLVDVAVGAAGSEVVVVPDLLLRAASQNDTMIPAFLGPFPVDIKAGTRLSVRAQCSITTAARLFDAILYGAS